MIPTKLHLITPGSPAQDSLDYIAEMKLDLYYSRHFSLVVVLNRMPSRILDICILPVPAHFVIHLQQMCRFKYKTHVYIKLPSCPLQPMRDVCVFPFSICLMHSYYTHVLHHSDVEYESDIFSLPK